MSRAKVLLSLFLLWGCLHAPATAQPVMDWTEFPSSIGTNWWNFNGSYDFGFPLPGSPPWDFSTGPTADTTVATIIDKSDAPFADSFPSADIALREVSASDTTYAFVSITPSAVLTYGFVEGPLVVVYDDPVRYLEFPLTMGDAWSDTVSYNYAGFPITVYYDASVVTWGNLTVPAFSTLPSLVLRTETIFEFLAERDTGWSYVWLVEDWGFAADAVNSDADSFQIADEFDRLFLFQTGVTEREPQFRMNGGVSLTFRPNPMSHTAEILLGLPASGPATLRIYDLAGRLVRTLFDGEGMPGVRTLVWDGRDGAGKEIGGGVYFARLNQGSCALSRKIILLR